MNFLKLPQDIPAEFTWLGNLGNLGDEDDATLAEMDTEPDVGPSISLFLLLFY